MNTPSLINPRRALLLLSMTLAAACGNSVYGDPQKIDKLHLLAVRADPAEIAPAVTSPEPGRPAPQATLTALVAHPAFVTDAARRFTVVYLACTPVPGSGEGDPCAAFDTLRDPSELGGTSGLGGDCSGTGGAPLAFGEGVPGGFSFSGIEQCDATGCAAPSVPIDPTQPGSTVQLPPPTYTLPAAFSFDALPAAAPERIVGVQVTVLALALDATPEELLAGGVDLCHAFERLTALEQQREHVTAIKRIAVRGPQADSAPNQNPALAGAQLAGAPLARAGEQPSSVAAGAALALTPTVPSVRDGAPVDPAAWLETWARHDNDGRVLSVAPEEWVVSWFATAGTFKKIHTRGLEQAETWTAPKGGEDDDAIPEGGVVRIWVVARDLRGGIAWSAHDVAVR